MHRTTVDAIAGEDALTRSDRVGSGVHFISSDVHVHVSGESWVRVANHQIGGHTEVVVGGEPVVGGELIGGIAHDRVEAAAENGALAGEDGQAVGTEHMHRSAVDPIAVIRDTLTWLNIVAAHITAADRNFDIGILVDRINFAAGKATCQRIAGRIDDRVVIQNIQADGAIACAGVHRYSIDSAGTAEPAHGRA